MHWMALSMLTLDRNRSSQKRPSRSRWATEAADIEGGSERGLRLYACGFGQHGVDIGRLKQVPEGAFEGSVVANRTALTNSAILLPTQMPAANWRLFGDAAVAHAIGHLRYSTLGRPVGTRAPMMVAMLSLIEDARVERLMMREYPGLRALWGAFHRAGGEPHEKGLTFAALAERLTLALHDPTYRDPHHWVEKGRLLVDAIGEDFQEVSRFNEAASILANDLGQMRVRFDPQSYLVEPAYRDDNTFLWRFDEEEAVEAVVQAKGDQAQGIAEAGSDSGNGESEGDAANEPEAVPLLYPEWNYKSLVLREDWVRVVEGRPLQFSPVDIAAMPPRKMHGVCRVRYRQTFSTHRIRRQADGDELDLDALVTHVIAQRSGGEPDGNVYTRLGRRPREASVLLLLDLSASTGRRIDGTQVRLVDCEREAAEQAIAAFDGDHRRIALHGFASNGRTEVRYLRLKDFGQPYNEEDRRRLWALQPTWSTRFGAALRHAGRCLTPEASPSKTIILITDGEPSDIDVFDPRYLVEDARNAVDMLATRGIRTQCVSVDPQAHAAICEIFGRRNCVSVERTTRLVDVLPDLLARAFA
jgi:nitric oxide reductase NorD protein